MGTTLIGWKNYIKMATVTATSSVNSFFTAPNMAGDSGSPSLGWQTAAGVKNSMVTIKPNSTQQPWDVIGFFRTNMTSGATATITLWNNDGTLVYTTTASGPVSGYGQIITVFPSGTVADYVQIVFDDSSNPDGFLNIPLCFCGAVWYPIGNASFASTVGRDASVAEVVARGGSEYPTLYYQRRNWNVSLDAMRIDETWQSYDLLSIYSVSGSNVLFIPNIVSPYMTQETIFGRMKPTASISYPYGGSDRRRVAFSVTERL